MKAVIHTKYGPPEVLKIKEIEKPFPKENEVLIKIYATTAHVGDTRVRKADPFFVRIMFGLFRPTKVPILGMELSGIVESVGEQVTLFKAGDEVFAFTGFQFGAYAEYICLSEKSAKGKIEKTGWLAKKPPNISFEQAAAIPAAALTVIKVYQIAGLKKGQEILINGASGSLGTYAIQLAKYYGAKVTAVCSSKNNALVKSLGADYVIDYRKENFTQGEEKYDVIFDAVAKTSRFKCRKILKPKGKFLTSNFSTKISYEDGDFLIDLIEKENLKAYIDKSYPISEIVAAHHYVDTGRKVGNVVLRTLE